MELLCHYNWRYFGWRHSCVLLFWKQTSPFIAASIRIHETQSEEPDGLIRSCASCKAPSCRLCNLDWIQSRNLHSVLDWNEWIWKHLSFHLHYRNANTSLSLNHAPSCQNSATPRPVHFTNSRNTFNFTRIASRRKNKTDNKHQKSFESR